MAVRTAVGRETGEGGVMEVAETASGEVVMVPVGKERAEVERGLERVLVGAVMEVVVVVRA